MATCLFGKFWRVFVLYWEVLRVGDFGVKCLKKQKPTLWVGLVDRAIVGDVVMLTAIVIRALYPA